MTPRRYDPDAALMFSHIPKCAGTTFKNIFRAWFGAQLNFLTVEQLKQDLGAILGKPRGHDEAPPFVTAHFNRARGAAIDALCPPDTQIMTIVRDPWERVLSGYFFRRLRVVDVPVFRSVADMPLETYLADWPYDDPSMGPPMSNFLPIIADPEDVGATLDTQVIAVGTVEEFETTARHFAAVLGKKLPENWYIPKNQAPRTQNIPEHLKEAFVARNPLEYAIYDWGKKRLAQDTGTKER